MAPKITATIVRPKRPSNLCAPAKEQDLSKLIQAGLDADPSNAIRTNSLLFKRAQEQIQTKFSTFKQGKASIERPQVPDFLCGFLDPKTGQVRSDISETSDARVLGTGAFIGTANVEELGSLDPLPYSDDECLQNTGGLPGGFVYIQCSITSEDGVDSSIEISGIDWTSSLNAAATAVEAASPTQSEVACQLSPLACPNTGPAGTPGSNPNNLNEGLPNPGPYSNGLEPRSSDGKIVPTGHPSAEFVSAAIEAGLYEP